MDGKGNTTRWERDIQGRVKAKIYPDGTRESWRYDSAGRLEERTDALGQTEKFSHGRDDRLTRIDYLNAQVPTASVQLTDDPFYPRVASQSDGLGSTWYRYVPTGTAGAGQLWQIDGPYQNDEITYGYDVLGRLNSRTIGSDSETYAHDRLGRRITHTSALGRIDYTYLGRGAQIIREQHASGLVIDRYHESNPGDRRLMAIVPWSASHPPGSGARAHLYRTRPENRIDAHGTLPGRIAQYGYDAGDRLTRETEDPWTQYWRNWSRELPADAQSVLAPLLSQYGPQSTGGRQETQYSQDPSDNLTARKGPAGQWSGTVNAGNQYLHAAGSPWQHDLAGNLLDDGKRSYAWDAQHRLISITDKGSGKRSEFAYDGQSRLTVIREYSGPGASGVETRLLWCEDKVCQKRDGWDRPLARYFDEGEMQGNRALHYVRDHLGSIRDLVSATGSPLGRLDYGPYGEEKATQGEVTEHRYAGMLRHAETGFYITHYRIYDPWMGRWLSRDPIGEVGGINLYTYVGGNPVSYVDPTGEAAWALIPAIGLLGGALIPSITPSLPGRHGDDPSGGLLTPSTPAGTGSGDGSDSLPASPASPQNICETCRTKYPDYQLCSSLNGYNYKNTRQALNALGGGKLHNPSPATSGPCVGASGAGMHWNVRVGGDRGGSVVSCTCCQDTATGPVLKTLYRAIY